MNTIKMFFDYLNHKPVIGIAGGFSSGIILTVQSFLTDESLLKIVAAIGVWLGAFVALITLLAKVIALVREMSFYFKKIKK